MMLKNTLTVFIMLSFSPYCYSDSVCDEELLKLELKQDLEDNGVLDCLR
jgi:hypothetical protein